MTKGASKKMRAYVLIETAPGKTKAVKKELAAIEGGGSTVVNLDAVTGPFDFIAVVEGPNRGVEVGIAATQSDAAGVIADAEILYAWKFPPPLYAKARRLKWLQVMGAGVDWALVPELPPGVVVTRAPGVFGPWMAEYVIGWCSWVTQRVEEYRQAQRQRRWLDHVLPDRLAGKTMTIVGLGDIGRDIPRVAQGVGMRVIGVSRRGRPVREAARLVKVGGMAPAVREADFVVLLLPLTAETRGIIGPD